MTRIELFGPLGIGKSTLHNRLLTRTKESRLRLLSPQEARRVIAKRFSVQDKSPKGVLYGHLLRIPHDRISARANAYFVARLEQMALTILPIESKGRWNAFSTQISTILSQHNDAPTRATVMSWIGGAIREAILFDTFCPSDTVIVDEGVAKRALAIVPPPPYLSDHRAFRRLSEMLPCHPTYVYLTASHEVILERIEQRRKQGTVARPHRGMHPEDLAEFSNRYADAARYFAECLREQGATVITVDAECSISSNTEMLLERFSHLTAPTD